MISCNGSMNFDSVPRFIENVSKEQVKQKSFYLSLKADATKTSDCHLNTICNELFCNSEIKCVKISFREHLIAMLRLLNI